ncbi:MAG: S41 family peptidase [Phycisphaerae bacterium]|nr:S41 family peptidase [Phycisphaerae bacterium]
MPKRNLAWILIVAAIALLMWQLPQFIAGRDSIIHAFGPLVDACSQIQRRYAEPVDDQHMVNVAVDSAINAMIRDLGDPHAAYFNDQDYHRFQRRTDGLYGGIGVEVWPVDLGLEVLSREPDSPAVRAEILPGDIITHVDDRKVVGVPLVEAVNSLLNGPVDSPVRITIIRPSDSTQSAEPRQLVLYRAAIKLNPVHGWARSGPSGWHFMLDPKLRIGYVRLVKFTTDVDERLDEEFNRLQTAGVRALIVDLRENTGGLLESAKEVADRFLESGLIVRTSGRKADTKQWFASREGTYPRIPVAVLVNGTTASAAEIVAGALRDHERAVVVGERTYGKGSVQEVVPLTGNHGAIKLTTAYYYLFKGECIHRTPEADRAGSWGVLPNVVVALSPEERRLWAEAWREISREPVPTVDTGTSNGAGPIADHAGGTTSTATTSADAASAEDAAGAPPESIEADRLARESDRLIERDPQLRKALEILQKKLEPNAADSRDLATRRS